MIVTEQPKRVSRVYKSINAFNLNITGCKGTDKCWGKIGNPHPFSHKINNELEEIHSTSAFLKTMIVLLDILKSRKVKYYWTHYLKCPGEFRKEKSDYFNIDACADRWLKREIDKFEPETIISFGKCSSKYLSAKPLDKFSKCINRKGFFCKYNNKIRLVILPHPSGANPLFNKWRKNNYKVLRDCIDAAIKGERRNKGNR